jgi:N-acetylglutamate synthase-like GNAT family acetyltransferase
MSSAPALRVRASRSADQAAVRELLIGSNLPVADLDTAPGLRFWVMENNGAVIGAIGLERHGDSGLLRSLVVAASQRSRGVGRELVATLEREAKAAGVAMLVLLTQSAEAFFTQRGYAVIDRRYAPEELSETAEFRSLCPASAICMTKSLVSASAGLSHG